MRLDKNAPPSVPGVATMPPKSANTENSGPITGINANIVFHLLLFLTSIAGTFDRARNSYNTFLDTQVFKNFVKSL